MDRGNDGDDMEALKSMTGMDHNLRMTIADTLNSSDIRRWGRGGWLGHQASSYLSDYWGSGKASKTFLGAFSAYSFSRS